MGEFGWGQPVRRKEDPRLLTGRVRFIADRIVAGESHAVVLRSPHAPGNVAFTWEAGDRSATDAAFARADRVAAIELINNRIIMAALETRGAIGEWDAESGRFTLSTASQMPHGIRRQLAVAFELP